MQECKNPSVGIWWFYYDDVLFADPVEVEKGLPYGDCIAGLSDHADYWDKLDGGQTNPLIGSAGVSAVPMAARVSQKVGQKCNPANFLLMHAMGPNVAGVIGTAVAAGTMLAMIGPVK